MNKLNVLLLVSFVFFGKAATSIPFSGNYFVGQSYQYKEIVSIVNDINLNGISGDVNIYIDDSKTYTSQITINNFSNPLNKKISFIGKPQSSETISINYNSTGYFDNFIIQINGSSNLYFYNIKFTNNATGAYRKIIDIPDKSNTVQNIKFSNCKFECITGNGSNPTTDGAIESTSNIFNLSIDSCEINPAYYGLKFYCVPGKFVEQLNISNTSIKNYQFCGIKIVQAKDISIINSVIDNLTINNNDPNSQGIIIQELYSHCIIRNNKMLNAPLNISGSTTGSTSKIYSNYIHASTTTIPLSINMQGSAELNLIHNTIASSVHKTFSATGNFSTFVSLNNIFNQKGNDVVLYFVNLNLSKHYIDHNAYLYNNSSNFADNGNYLDFTNAMIAFGGDANSYNGHGISWNGNWGAVFAPTCKIPKELKVAIRPKDEYSFDINNVKINFYPAFAGCAQPSYLSASTGNINGTVYSGNKTINFAKAVLYADVTSSAMLDSITEINVDVNGEFNFTNLPERLYALKIFPNNNTFPNLIPTYYGGNFNWINITPISADTCNGGTGLSVNIDSLETVIAGSGKISGYVTHDVFTNKTSDPIPGIDVVLDKIPPSKSIHMTTTDSTGYYEFNNLPNGDYKIKIDFVGLNNDSLFVVTIDANNNTYNSLDYCVDTSQAVKTCGFGAGVKEIKNNSEKSFSVAPNPFQNELIINNINDIFFIKVIDISGRIVYHEQSAKSSITLNTTSFDTGIYILQIIQNGIFENCKIIKN